MSKKKISNHINTDSLIEDCVELLAMREELYRSMDLNVLVFWEKGIEPHKFELYEDEQGEIQFKSVEYWGNL